MSLESWTHLFKSDARSKGEALVAKDKVSTPRPSDTEVQLFVRDSGGAKVTLRSDSVSSKTLNANCSCSTSKKGQLCKHIWAALLTIEGKNPEFLESKTELLKSGDVETDAKIEKPKSASQEAFKQKQNEYRKEQYQKQKQRLKAYKNKDTKKQKGMELGPKFPSDVEAALKYFSINGFELHDSLDKDSVSTAKKQLSRVFHPDKGGSHDEILELNFYSKVLENYLRL